MAGNNRLLWTDRGIEWLTRTVIRLAPVNENTANRLAAAFHLVHQLGPDLHHRVMRALKAMLKGVDPTRAPSTHGRIRSYLRGV
jgi:hypothetical protein